jgi:hypothetical protein
LNWVSKHGDQTKAYPASASSQAGELLVNDAVVAVDDAKTIFEVAVSPAHE